ncbi:hypothetical protein MMC08_002999 [Hypocenomyce scalaris]|nr:hypothetical protein [Hypocenomyce scalaris]
MDVLSSLATAEPTRLDTSLWLPTQDALEPRKGSGKWTVDSWSNYSVLLLAQVHNFLCKIRQEKEFSSQLFTQWQALNARVEAHEQRQPPEFQPLAVLDADPSNEHNPFQSVHYVNEAVCAATQMFDLSRLLLILARPERSRQERAARFRAQGDISRIYATRIIMNSVVNRRDINWANAVQLLNSAGLALAGWAERKALLKCLEDIQIQTGWNTDGNIKDLLIKWEWIASLQQGNQSWKDIREEIGPRQRDGGNLMRMFDIG